MAMNLMRRVRGAVGTAGVWAAAFAIAGVAGLLPLSLLGVLPPFERIRFGRLLAETVLRWGLGGAAMGLAFAMIVLGGERKRTLAAPSSRRFAAWGFVAGAIIPFGMATIAELTGRSSVATNLRSGVIFAGICGALGAALAVATLRAARRAPISPAEAPEVRAPVI
jgi:hypothetical protein